MLGSTFSEAPRTSFRHYLLPKNSQPSQDVSEIRSRELVVQVEGQWSIPLTEVYELTYIRALGEKTQRLRVNPGRPAHVVNVKNLLKAASFFAAVADAYVFRRCSRYNDISFVISPSSLIPNSESLYYRFLSRSARRVPAGLRGSGRFSPAARLVGVIRRKRGWR